MNAGSSPRGKFRSCVVRGVQALALVVALGLPRDVVATETPVTLQEVLASVAATHPELEAADRGIEKAEAIAFGARGVWDPVLRSALTGLGAGEYPSVYLDTSVRQATPLWGLSAYVGHRLGRGTFPLYKGELRTLSGGELRAGIELPLWRNGRTDRARTDLQKSKLRERQARLEKRERAIALEREAAVAYWEVVAAAGRLRVAKDLLGLATKRAESLAELARAGSVAEIVVLDNERLVLEREAKVIAAQRMYRTRALALSLFHRDAHQTPIVLPPDRVMDFPPPQPRMTDLARETATAMATRPDVERLRTEREVAGLEIRLARNQRGPRVDLQAFAARDLGRGPSELGPTDLGAGWVLELPFALRKSRGDLGAAKAELGVVTARLRGLNDRVAAEVKTSHVELDAAYARVGLARRQVEVARRLAEAEREKWVSGASDLVVVNLREIAAADAAMLELDALDDYYRARADLRAALGCRLAICEAL